MALKCIFCNREQWPTPLHEYPEVYDEHYNYRESAKETHAHVKYVGGKDDANGICDECSEEITRIIILNTQIKLQYIWDEVDYKQLVQDLEEKIENMNKTEDKC